MKIEVKTLKKTEQVKTGMFSKGSNNFYTTELKTFATKEDKLTINDHPLLHDIVFLTFKSSLSPQKVNNPKETFTIKYKDLLSDKTYVINSYSLNHLTGLRSKISEAAESFNTIISGTNNIEKPMIFDTENLTN